MDEDDEFVSYGTPLPEIEEEHVLRKKAARELEVRDEKGRQRFHGAFTGGFSAGYFNTVGTKEGWAPSSFTSSRGKETDRLQQRPEDFMDEEDFSEFGISTRRIHTTSQFQSSSDSKSYKRKFTDVDSVIPGDAPLKELVKPVSESIGIKILNQLGWKIGQGIGPRVKKQAPTSKMYGCSLPDSVASEEEDPIALAYTFAPEDVEAVAYKPKDDVFGLGYTGLSKESILSARVDSFNPTTTKSWLKKDKKKLAISGQAFGVGAFEDDDEDIYSKDDMSQYDFSELKPVSTDHGQNKSGDKKMGDIGAVLEGFHLSSVPPLSKKHYPPPSLPTNYNPFRPQVIKTPLPPTDTKFAPRHKMSAGDRSFLLGEKKFQSFQISTQKKKVPDVPVPLNKGSSSSSHSFRPFPNDDAKQQRYESYLKLYDSKELDKLLMPPSMTEWERQQELEEFARAAVLFKPLSTVLSSRFESRSSLSVEHEVMEALAKAREKNTTKSTEKKDLVGKHNRNSTEWHPASLLCKRFNVPNPYPNSSEESVSFKSKSLFEHMTFHVEEKEQSKNEDVTLPTISDSFQREDSNQVHVQMPETVEEPASMMDHSASAGISVERNQDTKDRYAEATRPPIDFFKDIFENSSSEEDDENAKAPEAHAQEDSNPPAPLEVKIERDDGSGSRGAEDDSTEQTSAFPANRKTVTETKKSGFGVFANLDLDALNRRAPKPKVDVLEERSRSPDVDQNLLSQKEDSVEVLDSPVKDSAVPYDLYGPELPPNYNDQPSETPFVSGKQKHGKHKVKHKHKHHKHKSKKKKKKHSAHRSSDDSSFDSDEDIPPDVILQRFKKLQKLLK